ncbi:MAG: DUF1538 domain-containing protein [Oscillospiraceae bacterium]|jgi:hypothetical protein|nr:DUF1538 domain-containing protein [Oscillospiraceae bacterium]
MNEKLKEKISEAFSSVMPITVIVLILSIVAVPMEIGTIAMFLVGALLLIIGMGFFSLGADVAMMPMGEAMGSGLSKSRKIWIVVFVGFLMGFVITIAEPDLQVLANQVPSIPSNILIVAVAVGVGIFLVLAILRILFKISLAHMLLIFYAVVFIVSIFTPSNFLSVAFDSGGVTTGPITVPFIMAMGVGIAAVRSDKDASDDSFGLVALCSVGPILAVLLLGIFYHPSDVSYVHIAVPHVMTTRDVIGQFTHALPHYAKEVLIAFVPIICVFLLMQLFMRRFSKRQLARMTVGFVYTYIGLVLFLTGANVGFMSVGQLLGSDLAASPFRWLLIPIGMVIGYFIVTAEPAVHVLNKQVEDITEGAVPQRTMQHCLSIGVAASVGFSMLRVLTGISIYWIIIPGYIIALALTFFVPKIFVGIAFDSGGVASGPMTSTFLLPLAMGSCEAIGGNVMTDAFGVVAMVAMIPLIAVQIMGLVYAIKSKKNARLETDQDAGDDEIIVYEEADENA